jgi:hypothetical protein
MAINFNHTIVELIGNQNVSATVEVTSLGIGGYAPSDEQRGAGPGFELKQGSHENSPLDNANCVRLEPPVNAACQPVKKSQGMM